MHLNKVPNMLKKWVVHPIKRRVAKYYLALLQRVFKLTVIGITGSAGKTTTKEMMASILKYKGKTVCSYANIDPVYNIPTTILKCCFNTRYLILEMGVEYSGEMDFYFWLTHPDIMVITNIFPTHTQFFKNVDGVFAEKSKSVYYLHSKDIAVLNSDDKYLIKLEGFIKPEIVWFGKNTQIYADDIKYKNMNTYFTLIINKSKYNVHIPVLGKQYVSDALAAVAVSSRLGCDIKVIKKGLEEVLIQDHRSKVHILINGAIIIDDTYNNNPEAMKAAVGSLYATFPNNEKVIVFGDMLELGPLERKAHEEIGNIMAKLNIKSVICVGEASKVTAEVVKMKMGANKVFYTPNKLEVSKMLEKELNSNTVVLLKGSRSIGLDSVVDTLLS